MRSHRRSFFAALPRLAAAFPLLLASFGAGAAGASGQTAPRPSPDRVEIAPDRGLAVVTLEGRALDAFREARVIELSRGDPARGFRVVLGPPRGASRPLEIATSGAATGEYGLELVSEKEAVRVALSVTVTMAGAGAEVVEVRGPSEVAAGTSFALEIRTRLPSGSGKITVLAGGREASAEGRGAEGVTSVEIPALPAGAHTLAIRVQDGAGGEPAEASHGVTVVPGPTVSAVALSAPEARSGEQLTGTLTLDRPAVAATEVRVAADAGSVTVPSRVVVSAGAIQATFPVAVGELTGDARTEVAAILEGDKATAPLVLVGPPRLSEFVVYGGNVSGNSQVMVNEPGDVAVRARLDRPAPGQGTAVGLSTDVPSLVDLPSTMTVPPGQTELVIQVDHGVSASLVTGQISATIGSDRLDFPIRFEPPALPMPVSMTVGGPGIPPSSSVSVVGGVTLTAVVELVAPAPAGGVPIHFSDAFLNPVGGVNQVVPAGVQSFEIVLETPQVEEVRSSTPWVRADEASFHAVEVQVELLPPPSELASLTFDEAWVTPFQERVATVAFVEPAPVEREVLLTATFPSGGTWQGRRITVPPGQREASAPVTGLGNGETPGPMTVTASYRGSQTEATITRYPGVQVQALLLEPSAPYAGDLVTVSVILQDPAPPAGAGVVVRSLTASLLMPEPHIQGNSTVVTFAPGATSASFVLEARQATSQATLSAANPHGGSMSYQFAVHAPVDLASIQGGDIVSGGEGTRSFQLHLSGDAPTPTEVTLSTDRPDLIALPASVTFPAGVQYREVAYEVLHDPAAGEAIPFSISATLRDRTVTSSRTLIHSVPTISALDVVPMWDRTLFYPGDEVRLRWTLDRYPSQPTTVDLTPSLDGVLVNLPPDIILSQVTETQVFQIAAFDAPGDLELRARTGDVEVAATIPLVLPSLTGVTWSPGSGPAQTEVQLPVTGMGGRCELAFALPLPVMGELIAGGLELATDRPDLVQLQGSLTSLRFPHQAGADGTHAEGVSCSLHPANQATLDGPTPVTLTVTWYGQARSVTLTLLPAPR